MDCGPIDNSINNYTQKVRKSSGILKRIVSILIKTFGYSSFLVGELLFV